MLKEMRRQRRKQRRYRAKQEVQKNPQKTSASYKINECKNQSTKVIQKENEKRKAVIRTQRWRLRIKLQKDNTDKQPTVPEDSTYNSMSKYDREKKEQISALQLACQPNKSQDGKDIYLHKKKPNIDEHIGSNRL